MRRINRALVPLVLLLTGGCSVTRAPDLCKAYSVALPLHVSVKDTEATKEQAFRANTVHARVCGEF